jgi:hypothetical protein
MVKVMEHEPKTLVPDIDDHIFDIDDDDDDDDELDTINVGGGTDGVPLLVVMSCLIDLVNDGWRNLTRLTWRKYGSLPTNKRKARSIRSVI